MTFADLYEAIAFCRHRIVHCGGSLGDARLSRLNKHQQAFVLGQARLSKLHRDQRLLPDRDTIDECIESLAAFAAAIYRLLTKLFQLPRDWGLKSWRDWQST
jgi:hypothetical protein